MTTPSALPTQVRPVPSPVIGVPFGRLLLVETRKLVDTRAGHGLLIVIGLVTAAIITIKLLTATSDQLTFAGLSTAAAVPQALLLPVLGVLAATSEWSQRTGLVTFTLEPRRLRVGAAKLTATLLVALAAVGMALAVAAVANLVGIVWLDGVGTWHLSARLVLGGALVQLLTVAQGVAFGAVLGNSALAIVALFLLPGTWLLLSAVSTWIEKAGHWLDLNVTMGPLLDGTMTIGGWAPLAASFGLWVVLPLLIGAHRLVHREVV